MSGVAETLKARLAADAEGLARALGLAVNRRLSNARELRCGRRGSLVIYLAGPKRGRFLDFEEGAGGDLIALVALKLGRSMGDAFKWAADRYGVELRREPDAIRRKRRARKNLTAESAEKRAESKAVPGSADSAVNPCDGRGRFRRLAWNVWRARLPAAGSPVEAYLLGRGIRSLPKCLGYAPRLRYVGSDGQGRYVDCELPAMVAAVQGPDGRFLNLHRTWLQASGDGPGWRKADLAAPRKMMPGGYRAGAIRLAEASGSILALAEGIETGLSVLQATRLPVWAAVAVGNFAAVGVPAHVEEIVLLGDGDEPGLAETIRVGARPATAAGRALVRAARAFQLRGLRVRVAAPEWRGAKRDWNDVLLGGGGIPRASPLGEAA